MGSIRRVICVGLLARGRSGLQSVVEVLGCVPVV